MRHAILDCEYCRELFCEHCSDADNPYEFCSLECEEDQERDENEDYNPDDEFEGDDDGDIE